MKILAILLFSFGILLVVFGISIFTPIFTWVGRKFSSSNFSSLNYNQPDSIRAASLFMGICFFIFGVFIAVASAALLNTWNTSNSNMPLPSLPSKQEMFEPSKNIVPNSPNSSEENNSLGLIFELNCPQETDILNMRKQANLNAEIITSIPCNAVEIKDKKQRYNQDGVEWYLVEYQQNTGWVAGKYLKLQNTNSNKTKSAAKLIAKKRP